MDVLAIEAIGVGQRASLFALTNVIVVVTKEAALPWSAAVVSHQVQSSIFLATSGRVHVSHAQVERSR